MIYKPVPYRKCNVVWHLFHIMGHLRQASSCDICVKLRHVTSVLNLILPTFHFENMQIK